MVWFAYEIFDRRFKRSVLYYILLGALFIQIIDLDHLDGKSPVLLLQCALIVSYTDPLLKVCSDTFIRGIFHDVLVFYSTMLLGITAMFLIRKEKYRAIILGIMVGYWIHLILDKMLML
jgi:hypothetical protein